MTVLKEKLWTRLATHFIVEIQVGLSWVQQSSVNTLSEAEADCKKALSDRSVKAARICEQEITHTNTVIWQEEAGIVTKIPEKMRDTGDKAKCPVCHKLVTVAYDGNHRWVICTMCSRTNPCQT